MISCPPKPACAGNPASHRTGDPTCCSIDLLLQSQLSSSVCCSHIPTQIPQSSGKSIHLEILTNQACSIARSFLPCPPNGFHPKSKFCQGGPPFPIFFSIRLWATSASDGKGRRGESGFLNSMTRRFSTCSSRTLKGLLVGSHEVAAAKAAKGLQFVCPGLFLPWKNSRI